MGLGRFPPTVECFLTFMKTGATDSLSPWHAKNLRTRTFKKTTAWKKEGLPSALASADRTVMRLSAQKLHFWANPAFKKTVLSHRGERRIRPHRPKMRLTLE